MKVKDFLRSLKHIFLCYYYRFERKIRKNNSKIINIHLFEKEEEK